MTSRDFCYWLQGFFELAENGRTTNEQGTCKAVELNASQTQMIQKHLAMVFKHEIDPSFGDQEKQNALNDLHNNDGSGGAKYRC